MPVQPDTVEDHFDAGAHLGVQHRERGETDAARSPGPGGGSAVGLRFALDDIRPDLKRAVEFDHLVGLAPFCGA